MRAALESDIVSAHLHNWIDLIFGFKQNGEKAAEFDNLFHHFTYENNINLDNYTSDEKISYMIQILEFGQTPKQLFKFPHPKKRIRQSFLFNDQILKISFKEDVIKLHKLIKEKEFIESKYEKIRRKKEEEKDTIIKEFEKEKNLFQEKKKEIVE
jgi:Beige/BEACH domain